MKVDLGPVPALLMSVGALVLFLMVGFGLWKTAADKVLAKVASNYKTLADSQELRIQELERWKSVAIAERVELARRHEEIKAQNQNLMDLNVALQTQAAHREASIEQREKRIQQLESRVGELEGHIRRLESGERLRG